MLHYEKVVTHPNYSWVVFLHGAGGSIQTWKYQKEDFQRYFNLLLIDLRDHGKSKNIHPSFEAYDFSVISADIKAVLDAEKIEKAHFVTLSFGSVLLQDFSIRYPQAIGQAVVSGGIFKGNLAIKSFVNLARFMNHWLGYENMYSLFSYLLMPRKRNQVARRIYQMQARKLSQKEYLKWVGLYREFFSLLKKFYHQVLPFSLLVVMGEDDHVFVQGARSFVKQRNNVKLIELEKAGHICNIEQHEDFNRTAINFLLQPA